MMPQSAAERLSQHARDWEVDLDRTIMTATSLVAFGRRSGLDVVLKVVRTAGEEWKSGELLAAFGGRGFVAPLAHADGAVLLKKLTPGYDLTDLCRDGRDPEATAVIAGIIQQIASAEPDFTPTISVQGMASGFNLHRHACDGLMDADLTAEAEQLYNRLCATQKSTQVLHGDLHHYNVLFDEQLGWTAIDPWGVLGELEFEIGASLRNPYELPDLIASHDALHARLDVYEELLPIDRHRALQWAFANTVLAALWPIEETEDAALRQAFIRAAMTMRQMLG